MTRGVPLWAGAGSRARVGSAGGIQIHTFALAARPEVLAETLDAWLNAFVPPEVAVFRPILPAVMCSVLYYPEMGDAFSWETGVSSQNEVYFAVPVARWQRIDGVLRVVEVGVVTPFIFVDNAESAAVGRNRFGFPKEVSSFQKRWGSGEAARGFAPDETWAMSVWDPSTSGRSENTLLSAIAPSRTRGFADARDLSSFARLLGRDVTPALDVGRIVHTIAQAIAPGGRGIPIAAVLQAIRQGVSVTVFNFRQFGHPCLEGIASYQELSRFRMKVSDVRTAGIQGKNQLRIFRTMVRPIVDKLGLRVSRRGSEQGRAFEVLDGSTPVVVDVDIDLDAADRLCWRHDTETWYDDEGRAITPPSEDLTPWNEALGPSYAGAFIEENAAERVLDTRISLIPISAAAANAVIARKLPEGYPGRMRPLTFGNQAGLRVMFYRARRPDAREGEELVWLDGCYASLTLPVRIEHPGMAAFDALLMLGEFTDNPFLLQAMRELVLAEARLGEFDFAGGDWLSTTAPHERLVRVSALALDRDRDALRLATHPVIDVFRLPNEDATPNGPAPGWDAMWEFAGTLRPIVTCGYIESPTIPPRPVIRRVLVSEIIGFDACGPSRTSPADEHLTVVFHCSRSDALFDVLELPEIPLGGPIGPVVRATVSGRLRAGTPVRSVATAFRIRVARPTLLWEDPPPARVAYDLQDAQESA